MVKKYDKIIDDAIAKANEAASPQQNRNGWGNVNPYYEYERNPTVEAAVYMAGQESAKSINIAVGMSLDIARKALRAYIQEEAEPIHRDFLRTKEQVDVLDGSRSAKNLAKRAVRFENLKSLNGMTSTPLKVKKAQGDHPTAEQFNELVDAFRDLWGRLFEIEIQRRTHGNSQE